MLSGFEFQFCHFFLLNFRVPKSRVVYRLLRWDEQSANGINAKDPDSKVSVFHHVIRGSCADQNSRYISTCGSLNAVNDFKSKSKAPGDIVAIQLDKLYQDQIIDLRNPWIRHKCAVPNDIIEEKFKRKFENYARKFEEVLLIGFVPPKAITIVQ